MADLTSTQNRETDHAPSWLISTYAMLFILAATAALIVGLLQVISWTDCVLLLLTGILLSGGVLYTIVTMKKLRE